MCGPQSPEASEAPSITADLGHSLPSQYRLVMFYKDTQWSTLLCANELFYSTQDYVSVENVSELNNESKSTPKVEFEIHPCSSTAIMSSHFTWRSRLWF